MNRRSLLQLGASTAAVTHPFAVLAAASDWQSALGYPTGIGTWGDWNDKAYRIGNYSGGYERMYRAAVIRASPVPSSLSEAWPTLQEQLIGVKALADDYVKAFPCTGLLVSRKGVILYERYMFSRSAETRYTSWSMAKSVTSLLLGICVDRRMVASMDDLAEAYVPELKGTLHGGVTLRNLANMSSGAAILHDRDNRTIYPRAFLTPGSDLEAMVPTWNARQEAQGSRYNYNELCPLTIGMVIRRVSGKSLAEFCQEALWQPLGAEGDATWLRDSRGKEFNCIGFAARLRDWARLGQLIAQRGRIGATQIVSAAWLDECSSWSPRDAQVRHNVAMPGGGYKYFFWHPRADGTLLMMVGAYGQRVLVDRVTETVLVHTAVDSEGPWNAHMNQVWNVANALKVNA